MFFFFSRFKDVICILTCSTVLTLVLSVKEGGREERRKERRKEGREVRSAFSKLNQSFTTDRGTILMGHGCECGHEKKEG